LVTVLEDDVQCLAQAHLVVNHQILQARADDRLRQRLFTEDEDLISVVGAALGTLNELVHLGEGGEQTLEACVGDLYAEIETRMLLLAQARQLPQSLPVEVVRAHVGHID